ncbi:S-layer homology domain-containing protein [Sporosarcina aquimarina]|uniref:S-layer homology domain-containing protein n=1 Tax=Sporosarcina aquimarina TaxID=114975 RepID=A0ABU4FVX3_9BACL|nr:S-layer homology domain-containing protein [Sporosarcina aquimarina]MDW0108854.1 S-layer homology domain-containing protein [Sporosarcina aquimarina]
MKKFTSLLAVGALSLTLAAQPVAAAASFPDVPDSNRFHDEINYLVDQKIITGYSNGNFQPKRNVTRGEAAIMIGRTLKLDGAKRDTKFKDVSKNYGASGYIAAATDKGIIGGFKDGTYRPDATISRGDMAMIIDRAFELVTNSHYQFKDVGVKMTAYGATRALAGNYITTGYPDGTFKPKGTVTREQFSAFIARGLDIDFKQKTQMKDSYAYDLTKQYVFAGPEGDRMMTYKYESKMMNGKPLGYTWESKNLKTGEVNYFGQSENSEYLMAGIPYSDYSPALKYPVKLNSKWQIGMNSNEVDQVTGVNKTVKTSYKTFTGAVEVTSNTGHKTYYVKGIGLVKSINPKGIVVSELKSLK